MNFPKSRIRVANLARQFGFSGGASISLSPSLLLFLLLLAGAIFTRCMSDEELAAAPIYLYTCRSQTLSQ
jgi:hypothetical protein